MSVSFLIRADATPRMGTGHVMRCLALAQAGRKEGLDVHLICRLGVEWLYTRLARENISLHILTDAVPSVEEPETLLTQIQLEGLPVPQDVDSPIWVALDGYHFDTACQKAIMQAGYRLLVIDDYAHLPEYHCDVLLNQNIGAEELTYHGSIGRKLLGLDYVLLREEFWEAKEKAKSRIRPSQPQNILVTLGGGNFIEHLEKIAADMTMPELAGRTVRVIQGAMDADCIRAAFANCPARLEIVQSVDDMPSLLLDTDLCITAGGSTCWELCCLKIPFLVLSVAKNQNEVVNLIDKNHIAHKYSYDKIKDIIKKNIYIENDVFIKNKIKSIFILFSITLRKIKKDDCYLIFDIINKNYIRDNSINNSYISYEDHLLWFNERIKNDSSFFVVEYKNKMIGYIRFDTKNFEEQISIALYDSYHNKGIGTYAIKYALKQYSSISKFNNIFAYIIKDNIASLNCFIKSGFTVIGDNIPDNTNIVKLCLNNNKVN